MEGDAFWPDTFVVPCNIALDQGFSAPTGRGYLGDQIGDCNRQLKFALQIVAEPLQVAELLL